MLLPLRSSFESTHLPNDERLQNSVGGKFIAGVDILTRQRYNSSQFTNRFNNRLEVDSSLFKSINVGYITNMNRTDT